MGTISSAFFKIIIFKMNCPKSYRKINTTKPIITLFASMLGLSIMVIPMTGCTNNKSEESNGNSETDEPNILLIVSDDVGYSDIGPFGNEIKIQSCFTTQIL